MRLTVMCDDRSRCDHGTLPEGDTKKDHGVRTDPAPGANDIRLWRSPPRAPYAIVATVSRSREGLTRVCSTTPVSLQTCRS